MQSSYFDNARTMFMTDGWKTFQEEIDEAIQVCTLDACSNTEEFWQNKGRLQALRQIARYEDGMKAAEEEQDA